LKWNQSARFTMHAEISLILHLKANGLSSGEIGVSKSCCGLCMFSIEEINFNGDNWKINDDHGNIYLTLATGISEVDLRNAKRLQKLLVTLIEAFVNRQRRSESVGIPSSANTPISIITLAENDQIFKCAKLAVKAGALSFSNQTLSVIPDQAGPSRTSSQVAPSSSKPESPWQTVSRRGGRQRRGGR